jgi:hypothetical protein
MAVTGGEGEPARKDQGARAELAGGDVMVGVDRRGWNDDDRGSGDGAQLRRCSGEGAHQRRSRGWGEARGSKAVRLSTLARVGVVGKVDPHGRPRWRWRRRTLTSVGTAKPKLKEVE